MTPEELDEARAKEAERLWSSGDPNDPTIPDIATVAARLARENWTPPEPEPEPVDPDMLAFREWATTLWPNVADGVLHGNMDYTEAAKGYLAGARMAREQERERAKVLVECVERYAGPHAAMAIAKYQGEA